MPEPSLIELAMLMIAEVKGRGLTPLTFMMNEATANRIADDLESVSVKRMSIAQRLWRRLRGKNGRDNLTHLCGVPVTKAPHIPVGGMFLQTVNPTIGLSNMMPAADQQNVSQNAPGEPMQEFMKRERVKSPAVNEAPSLDDLTQSNSNMPSVTDILIKALEGVEDLKQVVVIRVHRNDNLDMSLNCNEFEAHGVLQKAQLYLMQRGQ